MTRETEAFAQAEELRRACLGQNKRVEEWIAQNWRRIGLESAIEKTSIQRALSGRPVKSETVRALDAMLAAIYDDPWAWFEPTNDPARFSQYAPLDWWYDTLELREDQIPRSIFKHVQTRPLSDDQYQVLDRHYRDWVGRLRAACDAFKRDRELVRAVQADLSPERQTVAGKSGRVGNRGLHGRPLEDVAMALALINVDMTLPEIERACPTYQRPDPMPVDAWVSEPVEPFAGDEVEDFEWHDVIRKQPHEWRTPPIEPPPYQSNWLVRHWWDGSRYQVEDVMPFAQVRENGVWRDTTQEERVRWITGMERMETRAEYLERVDKGEWVANLLSSPGALKFAVDKEAEAEARWQSLVDRIDDEAARENNAERERRLVMFNLTLRRRKSADAGTA